MDRSLTWMHRVTCRRYPRLDSALLLSPCPLPLALLKDRTGSRRTGRRCPMSLRLPMVIRVPRILAGMALHGATRGHPQRSAEGHLTDPAWTRSPRSGPWMSPGAVSAMARGDPHHGDVTIAPSKRLRFDRTWDSLLERNGIVSIRKWGDGGFDPVRTTTRRSGRTTGRRSILSPFSLLAWRPRASRWRTVDGTEHGTRTRRHARSR